MGKIGKLTEEYYNEVKRSLNSKWRWTRFTNRHINDVAYKHGISFKTTVQVKNSATYEDYRAQVLAQHPDTKGETIRDIVLDIHNQVFNQKDNKYVVPRSAKTAAVQIRHKLK